MKSETVSGLGIALALALIVATALAVFLIGGDRLYVLAAVLVGGAVGMGLLFGLAVVIRAYRKNDSPPVIEKHTYHEGRQIIRETKVIDGRQINSPEIKLLQLPAAPQAGVFPEMLRAAFQSGLLRAPQQPQDATGELRPVDFDGEDDESWTVDSTH
jgi:hypothetical protein